MVICVSKFKVVESDLGKFKEGITFLLASVRFKSGCISCEVVYNNADLTTVLIYEEWEAVQQLKKHLLSSTFRRILEIMDMSVEYPEVIITEPAVVKNLKWIENYILTEQKDFSEIKQEAI